VVIGDDHLQAELSSIPHLFYGADAAVDGNQEMTPSLGQFIQRFSMEAIPLINPMRDIRPGFSAQGGDGLGQESGGGDPIGIEVAIDSDPLLLADRLADAGHRLVYPPQLEGVVLFRLAGKEGIGLLGALESPVVEALGDRGRQIPEASQIFLRGWLGYLPPQARTGQIFPPLPYRDPLGTELAPIIGKVNGVGNEKSEERPPRSQGPSLNTPLLGEVHPWRSS